MDKRFSFFRKLFAKPAGTQKSARGTADAEVNSNSSAAAELMQKNKLLQVQSEKLNDITWLVSHKVRGPVASILGLSRLFNRENYADPDNAKILDGIYSAANELDIVIKELVAKADRTSP